VASIAKLAAVYGLPLAVLALGMILEWGLPGLYMDAINPEYLARWILDGNDGPRYILPGNALFGRVPVFTGSVYHGSTQLFFALPFFATFGVNLASFRLVQFVVGATIVTLIIRLFVLYIESTVGLIGGLAAGTLVAVDPGFILALRTQAYSCIFPMSLIFGSLVVLRLWCGPPRRARLVAAGVMIGLAGFSYFIMFLFLPAILLMVWQECNYDGVRRRFRSILACCAGVCVGYLPFFIGIALIRIDLGSFGATVDFLRNMSGELHIAASNRGVSARLLTTYRSSKGSLDGGWVSQTMLGSSETAVGTARFVVSVAVVVAGLVGSFFLDRRDGARRLLHGFVLLMVSFVMLAIGFGDRLQGHHFAVLVPVWVGAFAAGGAVLAQLVRSWVVGHAGLAGLAVSRSGGRSVRVASASIVVVVSTVGLMAVVDQISVRRVLRETGGVNLYSDAITALGVDLAAHGHGVSVLMSDWGYIMPLQFLSGGDASIGDLNTDVPGSVRTEACRVGSVIVISSYPSNLDYSEIAESSETSIVRAERWHERRGPALFDLIEFGDPIGC